jgi:hypothetical protein
MQQGMICIILQHYPYLVTKTLDPSDLTGNFEPSSDLVIFKLSAAFFYPDTTVSYLFKTTGLLQTRCLEINGVLAPYCIYSTAESTGVFDLIKYPKNLPKLKELTIPRVFSSRKDPRFRSEDVTIVGG